jgi:hypothetical protein
MKSVTLNKKLTLNKKTIANLGNTGMKYALGGKPEPDTDEICVTFGLGSCPTICKTLNPIGGCIPEYCAIKI